MIKRIRRLTPITQDELEKFTLYVSRYDTRNLVPTGKSLGKRLRCSGSNGSGLEPWFGHFVVFLVPGNLILEPCDRVQKPEISDGLMDCLAQCKLYQAE